MLSYERRERIRQLVDSRQGASVVELSRVLGVSSSTIRRDLERLEQEGRLQRAHGGATAAAAEPPVLQRTLEHAAEKRQIARAAADLVRDGETVFLSSGTTTLEVARCLRGCQGLTVLTNALNIAQVLADDPGVTLLVVGGVLRRSEQSLVGPLVEQALADLRADKVILGIRAIHPQLGLTNDALMEVLCDRSIIRCAPQVIVVADHTKFGRVAPSFVAPVSAMHVLVTDAAADPAILAAIAEQGVRVVIARGEP
jgi:DeoR/GlpR family transcriptional regulator of sugar metabolism